MLLFFYRTKYEARDKQQQGRVGTLEKEKNSLRDELTNTVNELTQVRELFNMQLGDERIWVRLVSIAGRIR